MIISPEVLDYIFSFLHDDPSTLEACSSADPRLCEVAERYLYANLIVCGFVPRIPHAFHSPRLVDFWAEKPHLVSNTREISIRISEDMSQESIDGLESVLQTAPPLEVIALVGTGNGGKWRSLTETFRSAFVDRVLSPSLQALCLFSFGDFPFEILSNAHFTKLTSSYQNHMTEPVAPPRKLKSLAVNYCMGGCRFLSSERYNKLESVRIRCMSIRDLVSFPRFLIASSRTLRTLDIGFYGLCELHYP
jgi:hypothetical protein